jgi:hypothetical protein
MDKKFRKYSCTKGNASYVFEEDVVGWYLVVYNNSYITQSSEDHLYDTLEDALVEVETRFGIPRDGWVECT